MHGDVELANGGHLFHTVISLSTSLPALFERFIINTPLVAIGNSKAATKVGRSIDRVIVRSFRPRHSSNGPCGLPASSCSRSRYTAVNLAAVLPSWVGWQSMFQLKLLVWVWRALGTATIDIVPLIVFLAFD